MIETFVSNIVAVSSSVLMLIVLVISALALWVWALVACVNSTKDTSEKLIWILIIIFFNILGALIYLVVHYASNQQITNNKGPTRRLYRSRDDKILGGVCSGIAKYFAIDPVIIRIAFVLLFLFKGSGLLIYIICWIIIPEEPKTPNQKSSHKTNKKEKEAKEPSKKKKSNPLALGITLFVVVFVALFAAVFLFGLASYHATQSFSEHILVDEQGITIRERASDEPRSLVITPQRVTITSSSDELSIAKKLVEENIVKDYNYLAHNASNLTYNGMRVLGHEHCQPYTTATLGLKNTCFELKHSYTINSSQLPESVTGFEVSTLLLDQVILSTTFSEVN